MFAEVKLGENDYRVASSISSANALELLHCYTKSLICYISTCCMTTEYSVTAYYMLASRLWFLNQIPPYSNIILCVLICNCFDIQISLDKLCWGKQCVKITICLMKKNGALSLLNTIARKTLGPSHSCCHFCRQYFQIHFLQSKLLHCYSNCWCWLLRFKFTKLSLV